MPQPHTEKRVTQRFNLKLPVSLKSENGDGKTAETRDVSSRGICFYMDSAIATGSEIQFTFTLPAEVTLYESITVSCNATVVRVDHPSDDGGRIAVAAVIDKYEFLGDS